MTKLRTGFLFKCYSLFLIERQGVAIAIMSHHGFEMQGAWLGGTYTLKYAGHRFPQESGHT